MIDTSKLNWVDEQSLHYLDSLEKKNKPTPYESVQRKQEFLSKFRDAESLYNTNAVFRRVATEFALGASLFDLLADICNILNKEYNETK